ncbi:MAG: GtrA family protein [Methanoregula sp.]|jgi:putative flippase GtrA|nr:GtrA family protein [Methanoregula sp.]
MEPAVKHQDEHPMTANSTYNHRVRIFWFIGVGAIASVTDICLLWIFCEWFGIWYLLASAISYCIGILVSYCLNKVLTFHDYNRHYVRQFSTFTIISASCLLVNVCIIWLGVTFLALNYLVAKVIATFCAVFWNYYGQSRITFRGNETD